MALVRAMNDHDGLAVAAARLLHAACAYVDADQDDDDLNSGVLYGELERAREAYGAALRALPPLPPLPADHPLVVRGMAVVRRLLERQEDPRD